jgi:hypothetical protein
MNKGDIKATIILLVYISAGVTSGYYFQQYIQDKDGAGAIIGFILGVCVLGLLQCSWHIIRLDVED